MFGERKVRSIWDDAAEDWYFSVVDVVAVLTESADPRNYWKVLKNRLKKEGDELVTNCNQLEIEKKTGSKVISPLNAADTGALDVEEGPMSLPGPK